MKLTTHSWQRWSALKSSMVIWWARLSEREQRLLRWGSLAALVFLLYGLIWAPLSNAVSASKETLEAQQRLLLTLSQTSEQVQRLRARGVDLLPGQPQALLPLVESTLSAAGLSSFIQSLQQPQPNQLVVTLKAVPFDQFIAWVQKLWQQHAVWVEKMQADRWPARSGVANITLALKA